MMENTETNKYCDTLNTDGRKLTMIEDGTVDLILTDHPYQDSAAHKGGNRSFADYDCFRYEENDFKEKARVLKDGCFLVEFLPEESSTNFDYLYEIKKMAQSAGFEYYTKVPWKKGNFVANTGRKAKNSEDIIIFTKGKARCLKPDVKKNKANPNEAHFMSGSRKMLPTAFDHQPPSRAERIHQAEKPVGLLIEVIEALTLEGEVVLDQFAGSGSTGIAAMLTGRRPILVEKDESTFLKMLENVENTERKLKDEEKICG
ncbi:DNA modification methylase [Clostridiales Family XIII bacterium PM5-7]